MAVNARSGRVRDERRGRAHRVRTRAAAAVAVAVSSIVGAPVALAAGHGGALTQLGLPYAGCISPDGASGICAAGGHAMPDASRVVLSADGKSAYVVATGSNSVEILTRNASTGALTQDPGAPGCVSEGGVQGCAAGHGLTEPLDVAISADGKDVYVASGVSGAIAILARDKTTGALTEQGCLSDTGADGCTLTSGLGDPIAVAVSPNGKNVYVVSRAGVLLTFRRDPATGDLTNVGCVAEPAVAGCATGHGLAGPSAITLSNDGKSVLVTSFDDGAVALFHRNVNTGDLTQDAGAQGCVSETAADGCAAGRGLAGADAVTVTPNGKSVYVASDQSNAVAIFHRNTTTGALTQDPGAPGCVAESGPDACAHGYPLGSATDVAVSHDGKSVYVVSEARDGVAIFHRNVTTGALTQDADQGACVADAFASTPCDTGWGLHLPGGVAVSPNGKNVYVAATAGDGGLPGIGGTFDGSIAAFARQAGTGHLSQLGEPRTACIDATGAGGCAEGDGLDSASGVAVSANGRNAYVTGSAGSLAVLSRTPSTGAVQEDLGDPGRCFAEGGAGGCGDAHGLHGAQAVAVSKDGKSVYVAARGDSAVALFHRDVKTGHLTQDAGTQGCISETGADGCATGRGLTGAYDVAVSPNGTSVYVTGLGGDSVAVFHRDLKTGMLSQDAGASGCVSATGADGCAAGRGLAGAAGIAVSPDGKSVYVSAAVDSAVAVFRRNVKTGLLSQDAGPAGCVSETGAGGCATASGLAGAADVVVSANNKSVYVAALTSSAVVAFTRNPATGVLTDQRCIAQGGADGCDAGHGLDDPIALAISPDGKNVYVASFTGVSAAYHGAIAILQRSTTTGVLSQGGAGAPACMSEPASGGCAAGQALANATDVAVSPSNNSVYVVSMHYGGVAAFDRAP